MKCPVECLGFNYPVGKMFGECLGNCPSEENVRGGNVGGGIFWKAMFKGASGYVRIPMQDYKSLRLVDRICATLVNTHTHTHTHTHTLTYTTDR